MMRRVGDRVLAYAEKRAAAEGVWLGGLLHSVVMSRIGRYVERGLIDPDDEAIGAVTSAMAALEGRILAAEHARADAERGTS